MTSLPPSAPQLSNILHGREIFLHRKIILSAKSLYSEMVLPHLADRASTVALGGAGLLSGSQNHVPRNSHSHRTPQEVNSTLNFSSGALRSFLCNLT